MSQYGVISFHSEMKKKVEHEQGCQPQPTLEE